MATDVLTGTPWAPGSDFSPAKGPNPPGRLDAPVIVVAIVVVAVSLGAQYGLAVLLRRHAVPTATGLPVLLTFGEGLLAAGIGVLFLTARRRGIGLVWTRGSALVAVGVGAGGFAAYALVGVGLARLAVGRPLFDPVVGTLVSEGTLASLLVAVLTFVVVAPVIEEVAFRGILIPAFGQKRGPAVVASALLFAIAHLQPARVLPLFLVGVVLAKLYISRGLVASIAGHAAFNSVVVLAAAAAVHGPVITQHHGQVSLALSSAWHLSTDQDPAVVFSALGPSGARVEIAPLPLRPGSVIPTPRSFAGALGRLPQADAKVEQSTIEIIKLPAGSAVKANATVGRKSAEVIYILRQSDVWAVLLSTNGSQRARRELDKALLTLSLPPASPG